MLITDPQVAIDRVWSIRDAILAWLYLKAMVDGTQHPTLNDGRRGDSPGGESGRRLIIVVVV
jgi:hypothetical protein